MDDDNLHIIDESSIVLPPIRVAIDVFDLKSWNKGGGNSASKAKQRIKKGDCLLLRGLVVCFDQKKHGVTRLQKRSYHRKPSETWCLWRHGGNKCIECNKRFGPVELQKMEDLYSWYKNHR